MPEYCVQVLYYATVSNMKYIVIVVAGLTKVHYAVLVMFPDVKLTVMKRILSGIYNKNLKWAYTTAMISNDLDSSIPDFRGM